MNRSQSWKKLGPETEKSVDMRRAISQPLYPPQTTASESSNTAAASSSFTKFKSNTEEMRRRIVQLNKDLDHERMQLKNLKRDKAMEVRQIRDEEQKRAASMQADLRSKLHKEKMNELTALKEQLHKEKERDIIQIIKQKDENLRSAQLSWTKEREELRSKVRGEIWSEARDETKREFERERAKLEQEISDLRRQKDVLEDTLKLVQGADKRKIDDIRRIHHEHESELDKFKRNSWQESRKQMAEIRQLLNIIEQLEKKLGLEAGHSMRLRLEKDSLHDMLKKSTTFDAWDSLMSSSQGQTTPPVAPDLKGSNQELRMLQRKNVELSSLVRKLDEKNQQLATRNAELLAELEKLEKENRDKNRKLERNNADLVQTNKRLEGRNKMLLDEINTLKQKKSSMGRKDNSVKSRGQADKEREDLGNLRAQLREQTRNIADLKQSLMEKDRRIELLRGRKKNGKRKTLNVNSQSVDSLSVHDDETLSVHSDFSEASEQSNDDTDSRRVKKLAKELLALERAYALLQAHVGSAVDAERDEMERQQLQSDLIQSQARIHELERMMNDSGQGGSEEISQLQTDNKALYQKLMSAEKERDQAQQKLSKHSEDMIDLQDQRDLLEFELEEMSQLSAAGSEDWDCRRPRSSVSVDSLPMSGKENESANLSMEEVKTCLEELETEKEKMLSPSEQNALRQARDMLDSMAQKISHLQITESALRDKVRDLDLGYNSESMKSELYDPRSPNVLTCHQETLTDLKWEELEGLENYYREGQLEALGDAKHAGVDVQKEDRASMTDLMLEELDILENIRDHFDGFPHQTPAAKVGPFDVGKKDGECMTDLVWRDLVELENTYREQLDNLWRTDYGDEQSKGEVGKIDSETMTDIALEELDELGTICPWCRGEKEVTPKDDKEAMTEIMWEDLVEQANNQIYLSLSNEISLNLREEGERQKKGVEVGIMTDLAWSELVSLENTNLESIENTQEMGSWIFVEKEDVATATDAPPPEIQGSLPTIVLDQCLEDVRTRDECAMTDMAWDDVVDLQRECNGYRLKLENLEKKLAQFEVLRDEKSSTTDMSLQDLTILESVCEQMFKSNVEMNDSETMTDAPISDDFIEALPTIVLETYPGGPVETVETKDECDMTEGIWDEVVDLQNTYRDYRQNLDDMKVKLAQFEVEKDDKESITDMAMQDLADLENMYKDHLAENDSDANSVLSQAEKESKECMTELSLVELAELEDFYIENAARQAEAAVPVVEKWEQETMTEIASDDMQYLEEVEELYRQKGWSVDEEDVEKEEKSVETDLTIHDLDYLREVEVSYLELISREKEEDKSRDTDLLPTPDTVEKGITTDLTIPDLEHLEEVEALYQTSAIAIKREESEKGSTLETLGKEDKCEGTEISVADLKYLEEVEAAHEECLLDKEDDESKARMFSENTSNVEVMTDLTVFDLSYLEEVEAAHEECLLDKEEGAANAGAISEDKHSLGTMTDLSVSDLQDQEIALSRVATGVEEKEHVESMTDLSLSDLEYLEDIEAEHKEFLFDKKEKESKAKSVQIMTDLTVLDLKYLEYVEVAHENCMLIKEEEEEFNTRRISDEKQSVEIMTDLTVSDLKYLEDVEASHGECLLEKEEEVSRAKEIAQEKLSVGTMTDLTVSDLRDQEIAVSANERKEKSKWRRGSRSSSLSVHQEHKNTMTELTANIVEYLEDIEVVYKETVVEFEEFKSALAVEKEEKEVMTDVTGQDFILLEDAEGRLRVNDSYDVALGSEREDNGRDDKETMTLLCQDDLDYLMEVDILYEEMVNHQQSKETVAKSDVEVMTDLTLSHMEDIEDEFERLQEEQLQMKESSLVVNEIEKDDKEAMTELTNSELQYLEEVEVLFKGNADNKDDAEAMTDLTTADLEYLEEAENVLKTFRGNVDIQTLLVPKEDKEVITDVTSSDMEYMQVLVEKEAATFGIDVESKVEKDDKYTETEMTVADIRDLEDQAYTATEMRATPQLVNEDFQAETLMDLRSELEHLPIFDEPEFSEVEKDDKYTETEMTVADIRDLEDQAYMYTATEMRATPQLVNEDFQAEKLVDLRSELEHLPIFDEPEFIFDEDVENDQGKDVGVMTDLLLSDLDNLDNAMTMRNQEELRPDTSETGVQCELKDIILMMEELRREAEKNGEDMPSWFVSALKMRKPDGGFSPVHLVVSPSDLMLSHDTDEHPQTDIISRSVLDDTPLLDLSGDVSLEPEGLPLNSTWDIDSYPLNPPDAADSLDIVDISQDVGVQCDLVDFLSMVEEYHRDTSEEEMPSWFVSAMSMNRNSSGFDPVEVVLRKRSDSSVYESENVVENPGVLTRHSTNLTIELSRPLVRSTTVTSSYPSSVDLEDDQFECPEADAPLFTSLNASDNVFHETDSSLAPPTDGEERDVIVDMPQSSAVNRFDRFLKERKDSELKNMVALRDSDESVDGTKISKELLEENEALKEQIKMLEDTQMVRELQEENELLKEQIQTLEDATNVNDLEEENTLLKEKIQEMEERGNVQELEMENELLKEKLKVLEEATDTEDLEKENALLKEIVESAEEIQEENNLLKEELAVSVQDARKIEEENESLKEELAVSVQDVRKIEMEKESLKEELAVSVLDARVIEKENESLREELAVSVQDVGKIEAENKSLKEELAVSVQDVRKIEEENESLKDRIQVSEGTMSVEDLENENASLKEQLEIMMAQPMREKELVEGNEMLKEKVQILQESVSVEDLERENASLKEQLEIMMAQPLREKDLEDENEMLKEKVQILQESTNAEDLEKENASLKEQLEIMMAQPMREKELEEENEMLKEQIQIMEDSTRVKELEEENETLKENVQILEETMTVERLENEELKEKFKDLEESTARIVEKLEEENSSLKRKIQTLEDSEAHLDVLQDENAQLKEKVRDLETSTSVQGLEQENAPLQERIQSLEGSTAGGLSDDEMELLQLKIEQLKEAEKKIGTLNESNMALREKIDLLMLEKRDVRDNSSEMDPSEQLGRADRGVQAVPDVPPSVNREMQTVPGVSGGVNQEIQTNLDLMNIVELSQDGAIPEHIAKELEKLKGENRELYEELMELRRKAMDRDRQVAKHLQTQTHEATQTEHAPLWDPIPADVTAQVYSSPRDVISPVPSSIEEPIAPVVRSTVASEIGDLEERLLELENLPAIPSIHVGHVDDGRTIDRLNVLEPVRVDGDKEDIVSVDEDVCYLDESVSEPDNTSARYTPDSVMDDSILDDSVMNDSVMDGNDDRLDGLDYLDEEDEDNARTRTDTSDLVDFDLDDPEALPPLPESSPPPLPSEPPPDFPDSSPPVVDHGLEVLLRSESSPPRNAASLRASSRQRSHSDGRPSPEFSLPSSRVESPVTVEETMLMLEPELSELGAPVNYDAPFGGAEVQSEKPILSNEFQRPRVPPPVHPKPKRPTMSLRQPGHLSQPSASFVPSNMASSLPSQWSRDEDDGVVPPRGIVRTRASSLNRGEIDALNEKIGFLERQLRNKENVIRSMKTEATALETQSLLERRDREMKILEDDIAFLKQENQKKERELLTKIGEMNKKSYETEQWKAEANNSERQRQRMEAAHLNLQNQLKNLQGADRKLADLQTKHSGVDKQNWELSEKVKKLERTEREFKKLEHNIQVLQNQVQEMDSLEQDRNDLVEKMKMIENQRDDLLRKGRVVESERNDFLRNNKVMEMQRDDLENRCTLLQKTNTSLNARLDELDQDLKQAQTKMHDSQHERNYLQVQFDKLEAEKNELQQRLAIITQERNSLENQVAELQDLNRDHVKLEDGFHTLRIKLAELTRQKDDAEMQIPTLKAKVSLLKRACKEKDELVDRLNNEIRELRHSIATSALDDLSKIRSYGYSPENFVKLSAQREHELERAKRDPEDLIEARLKSRMDKSSQNRESKLFQPSPPGTKKAKRFVALFDYDPYNSPTSEHPELEVKLQEGEYLTVFGDMDINGYFEADVNGVRGLVPSLYVEEVEDDNDSELGIEGHKSNGLREPVKNGPPYKGSELQFFKDNSARSPMSVGSSSGGSEPRQCLVALDDYDPYQSGTIGHLAHEQVVMKKGDIMTSFGDMDVNGFYHVELNGQTGFVPGHLVEEVSSSSFLQPTSSRAPEQILGMLDNVPARSQPRAPTAVLAPAGISSQSYPTHALTDVSPQSHVRHPASSLPHVGMTRFKPAPEVAMLGPLSRSLQTTVTPRNSTQPAFAAQPEVAIMGPLSRSLQTVTPRNLTQPAFAARTTVSPVKLEKPVASLQSSPSKQIVPVSNKTRSSRKARPSPPGCLRILRPVNHDAMLVGWTLPEMDEFGRSNGLAVKGYKIYANRDVKLDVRSAYMAKALVEDLELRFPIKFSIKTVAENGSSSETVSAVFNDTIKGAALDSSGEAFEDSGDEQQYRTFVALYDYDPFKSSPNPNPSCEMSFKEGDILRIFDTSRKDGFYFGKLKNKKGLVPSNFVEEVAVASPRRLTAAKKQQATRSSPTRPFSRSSSSSGGVASPALTKHPAPLRRKLMVALYDYSPEEQSPQDNPDSELPFKKGQVIIVIGEMRADGFYQAEVGGHVGLVPGSFLDEYTNADTDSGLESGRRVSFEKGRSQRRLEGLERT